MQHPPDFFPSSVGLFRSFWLCLFLSIKLNDYSRGSVFAGGLRIIGSTLNSNVFFIMSAIMSGIPSPENADVSKYLIPYSSANYWAISWSTNRSSIKSALFPTKILGISCALTSLLMLVIQVRVFLNESRLVRSKATMIPSACR